MTADFAMPILVVDDYHTMVRIIRNLLKQIGYENVDDAGNGEEALRKIKEKAYGLIISDWKHGAHGAASSFCRRCARPEARRTSRSSW